MQSKVFSLLKFSTRAIGFSVRENGRTLNSNLYYSSTSSFSTTSKVVVGSTADLNDGEFKSVQVGSKPEDTVILSKVKGKYYATGSKCPHYGAPFSMGLLFDDKLICPWHNAAFSVTNGSIEQGPIVDGIPTYPVHESKGQLYIEVPQELVKGVQLPKTKRDPNDKRKFVILGGGPTGLSAAETLRQAGYQGQITLVSKEKDVAYDRVQLSKNIYGADINGLTLRGPDFFKEYGIDLLKGASASNIDPKAKTVDIEGGSPVKFDKLLIATGGRPRVPPIKGANLKNIFTIRNYEDVLKIREASKDIKNVVVLGASFIGMEAAVATKSHFKDKVNVIVLDANSTPFERVLGPKIGSTLQKFSEKRGLKFALKTGIKSFEGTDKVEKVILSDGTELPADIVIIGAGIQPNTEFASNSLKLEKDGGIVVNSHLQTSEPDIFAAGDIAWFPNKYLGQPTRIEHYSEAMNHGAIAALNMMGKNIAHNGNPFFWAWVFELGMQYIGAGAGYDNIHIEGNVEDIDKLNFLAYYTKGDKILSILSVGRIPTTIVYDMAMRHNVVPPLSEVKSGKVTLEDIKKKITEKQGVNTCQRAECCRQ